MTNTLFNKTISYLTLSAAAMLFIGCAQKTPSSYDNNSAQWQQQKSKEAVENIDK